jgi:hypothetical protein
MEFIDLTREEPIHYSTLEGGILVIDLTGGE